MSKPSSFVLSIGRLSASQNALVVSPAGVAPCIVGGGKGHDTDVPKILIEHVLLVRLVILNTNIRFFLPRFVMVCLFSVFVRLRTWAI